MKQNNPLPDVLKWYNETKASACCRECGVRHPAVIEFHHVDPETKEYSISHMVFNGFTMTQVLAEYAKTQPLCKNHHALEHYKLAAAEKTKKRHESSVQQTGQLFLYWE